MRGRRILPRGIFFDKPECPLASTLNYGDSVVFASTRGAENGCNGFPATRNRMPSHVGEAHSRRNVIEGACIEWDDVLWQCVYLMVEWDVVFLRCTHVL